MAEQLHKGVNSGESGKIAQIINEYFSDLPIHEKRVCSDTEGSVVIEKKNTSNWSAFLDDKFGPALKPFGAPSVHLDHKITRILGDIEKHQALYASSYKSNTLLIALWPWSAAEYLTVYVALVEGAISNSGLDKQQNQSPGFLKKIFGIGK